MFTDNVILLYKRGGLIYTAYPVSHLLHGEFGIKMNNIFDDDIPQVDNADSIAFNDIFNGIDSKYNSKMIASVEKIKKEFPQYELTSVHAIQDNNDKSFGTKNNNKHHKNISGKSSNHKSTGTKNHNTQNKNISNNDTDNKSIDTDKVKHDIHQLAKDYGKLVEKNIENKLLNEFHLK